MRNDGGIVYGQEGSYLAVVMSRGVDPSEAIEAESELHRTVYDSVWRVG